MAEYIDRQLAYETLKDYFEVEEVWTDEGHFYVDMCRELLDDIPAADVRKNVKGKWIERKDLAVECSACGQIAPYEANSWGEVIVAPKYDFCPWCGADMRKGKKTCLQKYGLS